MLAGAAMAATAVGVAPATAAVHPGPGDAQARLLSCHHALRPGARYMTVDATMHALAPGERMEMRFDLYRRPAGHPGFVRVPGPGLGVFNHAAAGVTAYHFVKRIQNLPGTADYRVAVTLQWLAHDGSSQARVVRSTPICHQVEPRPNLRVAQIAVSPGADAGSAVYSVVVANAGASTPASLGVGLSIAGVALPEVTVPGLAAGAQRTVTFDGPRCAAGSLLAAVVDPERLVPEVLDADNRRVVRCPAAAAAETEAEGAPRP